MGAAHHGGQRLFHPCFPVPNLFLHKLSFLRKKGVVGGLHFNLSFLEPFPQTPWRTTDDFKEQL